MMKRSLIVVLLAVAVTAVHAQEFLGKVTVIASRVPNTVDKKVFQTLQTQLTNFINNRKWTSDAFKPNERIECSFLLNIESVVETNVYKASLTVQAARPVFSSSYNTALINFQDADLTFRYVEYQPVEFNENRVQGTDPLASNLTATFAYYLYVILGLDYDSFGLKGGDMYFQKAYNITNNAPEGRDITGWKAFDSPRNRYWLSENFQNNKYNVVHDVIYNYYRQGLDQMYQNDGEARKNLINALNQLQTVNQENPNSMIVQFFMQGKSQELIKIFKKSPPQERQLVAPVLGKLDVANLTRYQQELK